MRVTESQPAAFIALDQYLLLMSGTGPHTRRVRFAGRNAARRRIGNAATEIQARMIQPIHRRRVEACGALSGAVTLLHRPGRFATTPRRTTAPRSRGGG